MKIKLLALLPLCVALFLFFKFYKAFDNDPKLLPSALIDSPLPEFKLPSLQEPGRHLSKADIIGEVMLINVWATWCPSCYQEHPELVKLARSKKIKIIGLNYKDERSKALTYLQQYKNPYAEVLFDESGRYGIELGVYGAPETYLVDKNGVVRYRHVGVVDMQVWENIFVPKLKQLNG